MQRPTIQANLSSLHPKVTREETLASEVGVGVEGEGGLQYLFYL